MALFFNGVNLDDWGGFAPSFDYPMRQGQRTSDRIIGIRLHGQVAPEDREAFFDAVVRAGRQYLRGSVAADATRAWYSYGGTDMAISLCCLVAVSVSAVTVDTYNTNQSISDPLLVQVDVGTASNRALYGAVVMHGNTAPTIATWYPHFVDAGNKGAGQAMTLLASDTHLMDEGPSDSFIAVYRLLNPTTNTTPTAQVEFVVTGLQVAAAGVWALSGVDQGSPEVATATSSTTASGSSVSVAAGTLILDAAGWTKDNATVSVPTATAGQTVIGTQTMDASFGLVDLGFGAGYGSASTVTWSWGATGSVPSLAAAVSVRGA